MAVTRSTVAVRTVPASLHSASIMLARSTAWRQGLPCRTRAAAPRPTLLPPRCGGTGVAVPATTLRRQHSELQHPGPHRLTKGSAGSGAPLAGLVAALGRSAVGPPGGYSPRRPHRGGPGSAPGALAALCEHRVERLQQLLETFPARHGSSSRPGLSPRTREARCIRSRDSSAAWRQALALSDRPERAVRTSTPFAPGRQRGALRAVAGRRGTTPMRCGG